MKAALKDKPLEARFREVEALAKTAVSGQYVQDQQRAVVVLLQTLDAADNNADLRSLIVAARDAALKHADGLRQELAILLTASTKGGAE